MAQSNSRLISPLIVAGMHRSGTSLTASILQAAGVDIGENLLESNAGNPKGYFEDEDFWRLHKEILQSQGLDPDGWTTLPKVDVPEQFRKRAQGLCDRRLAKQIPWGWKDPRTTLFLEFWTSLLPHAKFIFPYRAPWEVVSSLFRRGDLAFRENPERAIATWITYNKIVLDYCQRFPERTFLFHCDVLKGNDTVFVSKVSHKLQVGLLSLPNSLFDPQEMKTAISQTHKPEQLASYFPEVIAIYSQLEARADLPSNATLPFSQAEPDPTNQTEWFLRDWFSESQISELLSKTQSKVEANQSRIEALEKDLEKSRTETQLLRLTIESMESNRFWKLRNAWLNLKKILPFKS